MINFKTFFLIISKSTERRNLIKRFFGDIDKVLLIKINLQQLSSIDDATTDSLLKQFKLFKDAFSHFFCSLQTCSMTSLYMYLNIVFPWQRLSHNNNVF